jgi:prolyl-tRNA editing enzyme YbaK/EbsC (Cys-tRNA(Pro) deacylase)
MWPEPVERIASFLRESEAVAPLEELPEGVHSAPGPAARAAAFECDGQTIVALFPDDRDVDRARLARRAGCAELRRSQDRPFPYQGARVIVDRSLLPLRRIWLPAGSPRHVVGLGPRQLLRLTRAETGVFLLDD